MTTPSQTPETARTAEQAYDIRQREEWKAIRADILLMDEINSRDGLFLADAIYNAIERLERRLTPPQASKGGVRDPTGATILPLSTPLTDAARGVADATLAARAKGG